MPGFGLMVDPMSYLEDLHTFIKEIEREDGERVDSITFEMLRRRYHDEAYGITSMKSLAADPLAAVSVRPKTNATKNGPLAMAVWRYKIRDIHSKYGLSLTEYLALPRHVTEMIRSQVDEQIERESVDQKSTLRDLNKMEKDQ